MRIWLDDIRLPPSGWVWATTENGFKSLIYPGLHIEAISFDNDLGEGQAEGWQLAKWVFELVQDGKITAPVSMKCHSANVSARKAIEGYIADCYRLS